MPALNRFSGRRSTYQALSVSFGFALFYLRGVAPPEVQTSDIYRGVIPFVAIQILALLLLALFPELVTWLPGKIYG